MCPGCVGVHVSNAPPDVRPCTLCPRHANGWPVAFQQVEGGRTNVWRRVFPEHISDAGASDDTRPSTSRATSPTSAGVELAHLGSDDDCDDDGMCTCTCTCGHYIDLCCGIQLRTGGSDGRCKLHVTGQRRRDLSRGSLLAAARKLCAAA